MFLFVLFDFLYIRGSTNTLNSFEQSSNPEHLDILVSKETTKQETDYRSMMSEDNMNDNPIAIVRTSTLYNIEKEETSFKDELISHQSIDNLGKSETTKLYSLENRNFEVSSYDDFRGFHTQQHSTSFNNNSRVEFGSFDCEQDNLSTYFRDDQNYLPNEQYKFLEEYSLVNIPTYVPTSTLLGSHPIPDFSGFKTFMIQDGRCLSFPEKIYMQNYHDTWENSNDIIDDFYHDVDVMDHRKSRAFSRFNNARTISKNSLKNRRRLILTNKRKCGLSNTSPNGLSPTKRIEVMDNSFQKMRLNKIDKSSRAIKMKNIGSINDTLNNTVSSKVEMVSGMTHMKTKLVKPVDAKICLYETYQIDENPKKILMKKQLSDMKDRNIQTFDSEKNTFDTSRQLSMPIVEEYGEYEVYVQQPYTKSQCKVEELTQKLVSTNINRNKQTAHLGEDDSKITNTDKESVVASKPRDYQDDLNLQNKKLGIIECKENIKMDGDTSSKVQSKCRDSVLVDSLKPNFIDCNNFKDESVKIDVQGVKILSKNATNQTEDIDRSKMVLKDKYKPSIVLDQNIEIFGTPDEVLRTYSSVVVGKIRIGTNSKVNEKKDFDSKEKMLGPELPPKNPQKKESSISSKKCNHSRTVNIIQEKQTIKKVPIANGPLSATHEKDKDAEFIFPKKFYKISQKKIEKFHAITDSTSVKENDNKEAENKSDVKHTTVSEDNELGCAKKDKNSSSKFTSSNLKNDVLKPEELQASKKQGKKNSRKKKKNIPQDIIKKLDKKPVKLDAKESLESNKNKNKSDLKIVEIDTLTMVKKQPLNKTTTKQENQNMNDSGIMCSEAKAEDGKCFGFANAYPIVNRINLLKSLEMQFRRPDTRCNLDMRKENFYCSIFDCLSEKNIQLKFSNNDFFLIGMCKIQQEIQNIVIKNYFKRKLKIKELKSLKAKLSLFYERATSMQKNIDIASLLCQVRENKLSDPYKDTEENNMDKSIELLVKRVIDVYILTNEFSFTYGFPTVFQLNDLFVIYYYAPDVLKKYLQETKNNLEEKPSQFHIINILVTNGLFFQDEIIANLCNKIKEKWNEDSG